MQVLSIFSGPRKKGNTATVLGWVEEELKTGNHNVERINLMQKTVNGCIGCLKCKDNMEKPGCIQKDDGSQVLDMIVDSDVVIFAAPLYYWGFPAQIKALIDRYHCLYRGVCGSPDHTSFVEGQYQALIVTAADPFENNAEQILTAFQRFLVYNKAYSAGEFFVCNSTSPEDLGVDIKKQAIGFASQLFDQTMTPYALLFPGGAPNMAPQIK
jgi:multimeric flavodoxin WrbA